MPSRSELFGLAAIEAKACGTPVISSDLPSFRLTIKNKITGFRVKNMEVVKEWLETLQKIYELWKHNKNIRECVLRQENMYVKNFIVVS